MKESTDFILKSLKPIQNSSSLISLYNTKSHHREMHSVATYKKRVLKA